MPLDKSGTKESVSRNISTLRHENKPQKQAIAIALDIARRAHADGGRTHLDFGGMSNPPWYAREEARGEMQKQPYGLITSAVPGRTDRHNMDVPADTYVLPADVVAGWGESNTLAGAATWDALLNSGPHGTRLPPHRGGGHGAPAPPALPRESSAYASGGSVYDRLPTHHTGKQVPVQVAGGEFLINPARVAYHPQLGGGDPNNPDPKHYRRAVARGHGILDAIVKHSREKNIKELKNLPGPKK